MSEENYPACPFCGDFKDIKVKLVDPQMWWLHKEIHSCPDLEKYKKESAKEITEMIDTQILEYLIKLTDD